MFTTSFFKKLFLVSASALCSAHAIAAGMVPQTTVIILDEADGETSLNVKNTDSSVSLLYSTIENIPEDTEPLVVLTPPVARVEAGETQLVRFIKQSPIPLKSQRLKRVNFEGIKQNISKPGQAQIGVTIRQNLPLILNPTGLPRNNEPWKLLQWSIQNGKLVLKNNSPYVVRLDQTVQLLPSGKKVDLGRAYVLANETREIPANITSGAKSIRISPATVYGFSVDTYDAPVQ